MAPAANPPLDAQLYGPAANMALPGPGESLDALTGDAAEPESFAPRALAPPRQAVPRYWLALSTELVDKYHPDFVYFDWWIGQPAFKPDLQQFAAYYYNASASRGQQPVLTYKQEDFPANAATLDIERGKTRHPPPSAVADRYQHLDPFLGLRRTRRVPHRSIRSSSSSSTRSRRTATSCST